MAGYCGRIAGKARPSRNSERPVKRRSVRSVAAAQPGLYGRPQMTADRRLGGRDPVERTPDRLTDRDARALFGVGERAYPPAEAGRPGQHREQPVTLGFELSDPLASAARVVLDDLLLQREQPLPVLAPGDLVEQWLPGAGGGLGRRGAPAWTRGELDGRDLARRVRQQDRQV